MNRKLSSLSGAGIFGIVKSLGLGPDAFGVVSDFIVCVRVTLFDGDVDDLVLFLKAVVGEVA